MSPEILNILEVMLNGLMAGIMYSLVALGFVLIFKASGIFNFRARGDGPVCGFDSGRVSGPDRFRSRI